MIVRDGYPYVIVLAGISAATLSAGLWVITIIGTLLTAFMAYFFRDPEREIPVDELAIVSPADGRVVHIVSLDPGQPTSPTRISIFLSPFDVHVNRSPIAGRIADLSYRQGQFRPAMKEEASLLNEQTEIRIEGEKIQLVVKQIAGILARRVVCWKRSGEWVEKGERIGLIKFGSRTDVILPPEAEVRVRVGDRVLGGSSVIARIKR